MLIWDRENINYKGLDAEDREYIISNMCSRRTTKILTFINCLINSIVPLLIIWFLGFNILILAGAFVITDIILNTFDYIFFIYIPYSNTFNLDLAGVSQRIEKINKKIQSIDKKISKIQHKHCKDCDSINYSDWYRCEKCSILSDLLYEKKKFSNIKKTEENYLNKELEKIKKEEARNDTRQSKDYANKKEFFDSAKMRFEIYQKEHKMTVVTPIIKSLNRLIKILEEKPIGYGIIPGRIYIYLDETLKIVGQLTTLDNELKERYNEKITKISEEISKTVDELTVKIERMETEDIEVTMTVLLNELTKTEDNKNV